MRRGSEDGDGGDHGEGGEGDQTEPVQHLQDDQFHHLYIIELEGEVMVTVTVKVMRQSLSSTFKIASIIGSFFLELII